MFTTKYRRPVLRGDVALRVRELIREICRRNEIEIVRGQVSGEHVHLPPSLAPSRVQSLIKALAFRRGPFTWEPEWSAPQE